VSVSILASQFSISDILLHENSHVKAVLAKLNVDVVILFHNNASTISVNLFIKANEVDAMSYAPSFGPWPTGPEAHAPSQKKKMQR